MSQPVEMQKEVDALSRFYAEHKDLGALEREAVWLELKGAVRTKQTKDGLRIEIITDITRYKMMLQVQYEWGRQNRLSDVDIRERYASLREHFRRAFA